MEKERVAIIINAGIGVGSKLEGVVCLVNLCECIANDYELIVFSLVKVDESYQPNGYQLIGVPFGAKGGIILRFFI